MMTSSRSVYHGFRQRGVLVETGDEGRYKKDWIRVSNGFFPSPNIIYGYAHEMNLQ